MDDIVFTEDEIKEQLEQFGYRNVPVERLKEFKRGKGDSSVFVLLRTGHFENSSSTLHNYVPANGRKYILHLHGSCHTRASMCV